MLDITGYFVPTVQPNAAGRLVAVTPTRIFYTRPGTALNYTGTKPTSWSTTRVEVIGVGPVPATNVAAVVLNVTATEASAPGFVQVAPAGALVAGTSSNLNLERIGQTIPNQVIVPIGVGGGIEIFTQSGTHLIVDAAAYITSPSAPTSLSGLFVPVTPGRVLDTRPGTTTGYTGPTPGPGVTVRVDTNNKAGIPPAGVGALATNVTITEAAAAGFVQAAATGTLQAGTSSVLNADRAGQTIANSAIIPLSDGRFDLYTQSGGHLLTDVFGWYVA